LLAQVWTIDSEQRYVFPAQSLSFDACHRVDLNHTMGVVSRGQQSVVGWVTVKLSERRAPLDRQVVEVVQAMVLRRSNVLDGELTSLSEPGNAMRSSPIVVANCPSDEGDNDQLSLLADPVVIEDSGIVEDASAHEFSPSLMNELLDEKRRLLDFDGLDPSYVGLRQPSHMVSCRLILQAEVNWCIRGSVQCQSLVGDAKYIFVVCNAARVLFARILVLRRWQRNQSSVLIVRGLCVANADSLLGGGLLNQTNTCSVNAFIQVLFNLLPLRLLILC
jgi:hypothetical protein